MDTSPLPIDIGALNATAAIQRAQALVNGAGGEDKTRETAEKLEALFATMLVKELRKSLPNEGFFGEGRGADIFNGWMDEFLGQQLADDGALDLAGRVKVALDRKNYKHA